MPRHLTDEQQARLESAIERGGVPRIFWPDIVAVVETLVGECVGREAQRLHADLLAEPATLLELLAEYSGGAPVFKVGRREFG